MKYFFFARARLALALTVMVLVFAACWGGAAGKMPVGPTVPTEAPPPSPTAPPDVSTVPTVIDEAYLNEVLKALNKVDGDAMRLIVQEEDLLHPAAERLRAVYLNDELDQQLSLWGDQLVEGFADFRKPPGDKVNVVRRVITSRPDCVYLESSEDYSAVSIKAGAPFTIFLALQPKVDAQDPGKFNRTAWMISFSGTSPRQTDPGLDPCAG